MSHDATNVPDQAPTAPADPLPIAADGLNRGQRAALEVAESARDQGDGAGSFAGRLFMGRFDPRMLLPFPEQTGEERRAGDRLVREVSVFLAEHLDADEVDETRTIPDHVIEGLRALGVFRMKVPQAFGGLGLSQVNYNRVLMAIASRCASTAVLVSAHQSIGVPQPLKMFGTDAQKDNYLRRIANGALSAFALTETDVGSDPARMTTTARLSEDSTHYILNGVKQWATNAPISQLMVVMAQTEPKMRRGKAHPQITAFVVETDCPGVKVTHRCDFMGLRGIQNGLIEFNNVMVPVENVIWGEGLGLKLALKTLNTGRLTLPAACTGFGKQCLSIVRRWGNDRVQWGLPIGRHEAGREKIAFIACTTFAMEAMTWLTSHWADEGADIRIEAAMAKLFCSEASWKIVDETMQFRAGRGYERAASLRARGEAAYPVERMLRDCRINMIIEGTSEIMRLFLAREALDPHLKLAADLLRPGVPRGRRLRAAGKVVRFYGTWYPAQLFGGLWPKRYPALGRLGRHYRYIDRAAHRLAAAGFGAMARHRQKLERRQVLLGHLVDIGTELFAMASACAYARSLAPRPDGDGQPEQLADLFCRQGRERVEAHFRALRSHSQRRANGLAGEILDGEYEWMEEGIIQTEPAG
ncbi:MAG: acyl-CoA dehydrogenase family protein [Planctomycetota bacterium]|jgi:alkylation response protein AidB-like acyl-CoA dehydrogenase